MIYQHQNCMEICSWLLGSVSCIVHLLNVTLKLMFGFGSVPSGLKSAYSHQEPDTIGHRILDCGNGRRIWKWTKERLAQILNTTPDQIPDEWPTCPQYIIRPQRRNRATSWMLATLITFRMNTPPTTTLQDYIEVLKRSRWKLPTSTKRWKELGTVLHTMDFNPV